VNDTFDLSCSCGESGFGLPLDDAVRLAVQHEFVLDHAEATVTQNGIDVPWAMYLRLDGDGLGGVEVSVDTKTITEGESR
jgi:hypothetical protein